MFVVEKNTASEWFSALRDQIINAFVGLEQSHQSGPGAQVPAGVFEVTETRRHSEDGSDAGGGVMSVLRGGRLFEKVGVNVSTVHGHLAASAQAAMGSAQIAARHERRSAVLGQWYFIGGSYAEPALSRGSYEYPYVLDPAWLVVWRWVRFEPLP